MGFYRHHAHPDRQSSGHLKRLGVNDADRPIVLIADNEPLAIPTDATPMGALADFHCPDDLQPFHIYDRHIVAARIEHIDTLAIGRGNGHAGIDAHFQCRQDLQIGRLQDGGVVAVKVGAKDAPLRPRQKPGTLPDRRLGDDFPFGQGDGKYFVRTSAIGERPFPVGRKEHVVRRCANQDALSFSAGGDVHEAHGVSTFTGDQKPATVGRDGRDARDFADSNFTCDFEGLKVYDGNGSALRVGDESEVAVRCDCDIAR